MPAEYAPLAYRPTPFEQCPKCGKAFEPFLRGQVHSGWRILFGRPYCAVICRACKQIVGHEKP